MMMTTMKMAKKRMMIMARKRMMNLISTKSSKNSTCRNRRPNLLKRNQKTMTLMWMESLKTLASSAKAAEAVASTTTMMIFKAGTV